MLRRELSHLWERKGGMLRREPPLLPKNEVQRGAFYPSLPWLFPFHCWLMFWSPLCKGAFCSGFPMLFPLLSRFTVGFILSYFPVSLLELSAPPVSLAGSTPAPGRLFVTKLINVDSRDVRKCVVRNIPACSTLPVLQVVIRPFCTPRINPDPTGNSAGRA